VNVKSNYEAIVRARFNGELPKVTFRDGIKRPAQTARAADGSLKMLPATYYGWTETAQIDTDSAVVYLATSRTSRKPFFHRCRFGSVDCRPIRETTITGADGAEFAHAFVIAGKGETVRELLNHPAVERHHAIMAVGIPRGSSDKRDPMATCPGDKTAGHKRALAWKRASMRRRSDIESSEFVTRKEKTVESKRQANFASTSFEVYVADMVRAFFAYNGDHSARSHDDSSGVRYDTYFHADNASPRSSVYRGQERDILKSA
jgi:hypothetical protein